MIKKLKTTVNKGVLHLAIVTSITLSALPFTLQASNISLEQMTADITYLASDKLKGRANFSADIDKAADYISQRFESIGLKHLSGLTTYKQTFEITNISPVSLDVTLNGQILHFEKQFSCSTFFFLLFIFFCSSF